MLSGNPSLSHRGARALPRYQIAFREQLLVRIHDDSTRKPEIGSQRPGGWQWSSALQASGTNCCAQFILQLRAQRLACLAIDADQELRSRGGSAPSGTPTFHRTGPVSKTSKGYAVRHVEERFA